MVQENLCTKQKHQKRVHSDALTCAWKLVTKVNVCVTFRYKRGMWPAMLAASLFLATIQGAGYYPMKPL